MLKDLVRKALVPEPAAPPAPGLHHHYREDDGRTIRYHLRVEPDGSGLVLANAASACRLSPSGVLIAARLLEGDTETSVVRQVARRFSGVSRATLNADVTRVAQMLTELGRPGGGWPLRNLDEPGASVHRRSLSAPLSADVSVADAARGREIVGRLWSAAVPQVVLVPEEGFDGAALVQLVEHAEDLGLITGLRARATDLAPELLHDLAAAGLDRVDAYFAGDAHDDLFGRGDLAAFEALVAQVRALELCPVAVVPATARTLPRLGELIRGLGERQVPAAVVYALVGEVDGALRPEALAQAAALAEEGADHAGITLVWAPPVGLSADTDLSAALRRGPRCAGEAAVRVAVDGAVLPPTGPARSAGNLLTDDWARVWNAPVFDRYLGVTDDPPRCATCPGLGACALGCPKDPETWARADEGALS